MSNRFEPIRPRPSDDRPGQATALRRSWWWIAVLLLNPPCVAVLCVLAAAAINHLRVTSYWLPWMLIITAPMVAWSSAFATALHFAREWSPLFLAIIVLELIPIYFAWAHTVSFFVTWR